jgi:hypothetical protein
MCYSMKRVLQLTHFWQVPILLARNHPYSGRPNNNQQRVAALGCSGLSSSRALKAKLSRAPLDYLEINQDLDSLTQPNRDNRNKVDVRLLFMNYCLNSTNPERSIWQYPGSTAYYRPVR